MVGGIDSLGEFDLVCRVELAGEPELVGEIASLGAIEPVKVEASIRMASRIAWTVGFRS